MALSETQLRALRWIDGFPSTKASWTVDGKPVKKQPPESWNMMRIEGDQGSILIHKDDLQVLIPYVKHCTARNQLYALNDAGKAALLSNGE